MVFEANEVEAVLRSLFGFQRTGIQVGSHTVLRTADGRRVTPKFTRKDIDVRTLQCLRKQLDAQGLDGSRFWARIRNR